MEKSWRRCHYQQYRLPRQLNIIQSRSIDTHSLTHSLTHSFTRSLSLSRSLSVHIPDNQILGAYTIVRDDAGALPPLVVDERLRATFCSGETKSENAIPESVSPSPTAGESCILATSASLSKSVCDVEAEVVRADADEQSDADAELADVVALASGESGVSNSVDDELPSIRLRFSSPFDEKPILARSVLR
jgi:hypothetical protein